MTLTPDQLKKLQNEVAQLQARKTALTTEAQLRQEKLSKQLSNIPLSVQAAHPVITGGLKLLGQAGSNLGKAIAPAVVQAGKGIAAYAAEARRQDQERQVYLAQHPEVRAQLERQRYERDLSNPVSRLAGYTPQKPISILNREQRKARRQARKERRAGKQSIKQLKEKVQRAALEKKLRELTPG